MDFLDSKKVNSTKSTAQADYSVLLVMSETIHVVLICFGK